LPQRDFLASIEISRFQLPVIRPSGAGHCSHLPRTPFLASDRYLSDNPTNRDLETVAPSPGTIRPILLSNLERQAAPMKHWSKRLCVLLVLPSFLAFSAPVEAQQPTRTLLLDAIATTYDIHRTETLVYLRVYSDGFAEAHPTHEVDCRTLALKQAQIPAPD
jgi:hypothetical protein